MGKVNIKVQVLIGNFQNQGSGRSRHKLRVGCPWSKSRSGVYTFEIKVRSRQGEYQGINQC